MSKCKLCGNPVSGARCLRCGMPFYDDEGIRYHLNESASTHEKHSPGNRVFSPYMEPRRQASAKGTSYKKSDFPVVSRTGYGKQEKKLPSGGTIALWIILAFWVLSMVLGIE